MPTYDFQCERCFAVHEQLVNAAITMTPCLSCNAPAKRLVSAPAGIRMGDGRARRKDDGTAARDGSD
jgi:putative FmdB family regulatory protein